MGKNDYSDFIRELTEDPNERAVLKSLLIGIRNKYKVKLTSGKLPQHDRDAIRMTAEFLQRPELIKSFYVIVMKKLRYQSPEVYRQWIEDMTGNYDYALSLRKRFKPTQSYKALGDYMAGLSRFSGDLTAEQKTCLVALSYVTNSPSGAYVGEEAFIYNWDDHYVRLQDSAMVEYICHHPEKAVMVTGLITESLVIRPAEVEAALAGGTSSLLNGSL